MSTTMTTVPRAAAPAVAPSRAATRPLAECKTLADAFGSADFLDRIRASVPRHVSPDRMLRTFVMATSRTPDLLKCNMRSVLGAMLTCSQLGLEPNTALGHAYLIPFANRKWNPATRARELVGYDVQLIIGYAGMLDLSFRSGMVRSVHCDVVWPGDDFSFAYGTDAHLRHIPRGLREEGAQPVWAYMHAQLDGGQAFEVLPYADVLRIRNLSQGYRAALAARERAEEKGWKPPAAWTDAPWVKHEIAMARKTALRAGSKWLPRSIEMAAAVAIDEAQDRAALDFGVVLDGRDVTSAEIPAIEHEQTVEAVEIPAHVDPDPEPEPVRVASPRRRTRREARADERTHAEAPPASSTTPARADSPTHYYLVDEAGELVDGPDGHTLDPVVWAERFVARWQHAGDGRRALVEHNEDTIADARAASRDADATLAVLDDSAGEPAAEGCDADAPADADGDAAEDGSTAPPPDDGPRAFAAIEVPTNARGNPDLRRWLTAVQSSLRQHVSTEDELSRWMAAQSRVYRDLPKATRAAFDLAYVARRDELLAMRRA